MKWRVPISTWHVISMDQKSANPLLLDDRIFHPAQQIPYNPNPDMRTRFDKTHSLNVFHRFRSHNYLDGPAEALATSLRHNRLQSPSHAEIPNCQVAIP